MENAENAGAFEDYARSLIAGDRKALIAVIGEEISRGGQDDCERIAAILSYATLGGNGGDYYSARYGNSFDKRYVDLFLQLCKEGGIRENEYIKVLLAAGSADRSSALYRWNGAVDVYLTRRAGEDFDTIADYIEKYDRKYTKYGVLIRIDSNRALERLVSVVLYGKNVDKTAIRDILMDHVWLAEPLMALYHRSNARERAAIVRLLLLYVNDLSVKAFIEETVVNDKSKTVRDVLPRKKKTVKRAAAPFFEKSMADGDMYTLLEWKELLKSADYAAVADRTFFFTREDGEIKVLVYNDGVFLDMTDTPAPLKESDFIGVLHPADLPKDSDILSFKIAQPFKQIQRRIFTSPRSGRAFDALTGALTDRAAFDARFKQLGFLLGGKRSASEKDVALKFVGKSAIGVECDFSESSDTVSCVGLKYYRASDVVKLNRTYFVAQSVGVSSSSLGKREYSELTLAAYTLFGRE
ncbi:MAG: DUF4132 domain-containing protein [Clostridiales bacterium]|nr:DUF4132 domain-containing protein [Clostridiales bacterium]